MASLKEDDKGRKNGTVCYQRKISSSFDSK